MQLESFSSGYWLAGGVTVDTHEGEYALMDETLYDSLVQTIGDPLVGHIDGLHYEFIPTRNVLTDRVAVPARNHSTDRELLLLLAK
ncbi:hypothetical protein [Halomonas sp.]|uniref:hypothetical protein n=1 Tax=Halomonas sp. TaxID=1486246 RepID=UPI00356341AC